MLALAIALSLASVATAQSPSVPSRQIPSSVLVELQRLENSFELALAEDCDAERCYPTGCAYVDHEVADRPRSGSLPGLGPDPGPGVVEPQDYLTQAQCSFAHEASLESRDAQALARRLQSKLSTGWTVVTVDRRVLQPLPQYLREPPEAEPVPVADEPETVEPSPPPPVEAWSLAKAGRDLWETLLPHAYWMVGLLLTAVLGVLLIWAWRRVGRASLEEQALLAELARGDAAAPADGATPATVEEDPDAETEAFVAAQTAAWTARLDHVEADQPDPELHTLVRGLLRDGELALLAKAVLTFPERFPAVFPSGGELATAKLELADYLKTVDTDSLPGDAEFFAALNRHALSAALATQSDAQLVRSLQEDFGASGLVGLIGGLSPRIGALVFALAPAQEQHEVVRLLSARQVWDLSEQLLRSNRMDPAEADAVFDVLGAQAGALVPGPSHGGTEVTDRGAAFDAVGSLSVLLPRLDGTRRSALFGAALERFRGTFPAWYRGIFLGDMLLALPEEARVDLLLEVEAEPLAAWLSLLDAETQAVVVASMPAALRSSVGAASAFPSRSRQLALAARGRRDLARGFQRELARAGLPFEAVVQPDSQAAR